MVPLNAPSAIQLLASSLRFRTLVTLFVATDLVDDLRAPGPWVVLAPPDETFMGHPSQVLERLFSSRRAEELVDLAESLVCRRPAPGGPLVSMLGDRVAPSLDFSRTLSGARLLRAYRCSNGEVLELDRVPLPPSGFGRAAGAEGERSRESA